jgi:hypothetical protein
MVRGRLKSAFGWPFVWAKRPSICFFIDASLTPLSTHLAYIDGKSMLRAGRPGVERSVYLSCSVRSLSPVYDFLGHQHRDIDLEALPASPLGHAEDVELQAEHQP